MVVHLGVVIIAVALAASSSYSHQQELILPQVRRPPSAGHEVTFVSMSTVQEQDKTVTRAQIAVDGGKVYEPALSTFPAFGTPIGTPSVRTSWRDDVYLQILALPEADGDPITLRVIVRPLIVWLWIGGIMMALGTVLAAFPGRRRVPTMPVSARVHEEVREGDVAAVAR
jgi:cytochrome c-type biogenesis protein CcmF